MIPENYKYACVALHTGMSVLQAERITLADGLFVSRRLPAEVPAHWKSWLGSNELEELAEADVHITAVAPSNAPEILDEENERLLAAVQHVYAGLLIGTPGVRVFYGRSLTGAHRPVEGIDLRSTQRLNTVNNVVGSSQSTVIADGHLRLAHQIGERLRWMRRAEMRDGFGDFGRLKRCISALFSSIESPRLDHRLHQAVRVIEGVTGAGKEDFRRNQMPRLLAHILCDEPRLTALPGTLYTLRSKVEHLYGASTAVIAAGLARAGEERDAYVRFAQATHSAEFLAHALLSHVIQHDLLWLHFSDEDRIPHFWDREAESMWTLRVGRALWEFQRTFDQAIAERAFDDHAEDAAFEAKTHI